MKGWIDIGSDVNWQDYGGKWARIAKDGSIYVLDFTNMYEACGEKDCKATDTAQYECQIRRVVPNELTPENIDDALRCVGLRMTQQGVVSDVGDLVASVDDAKRMKLVVAEACVSWGLAQPIEAFTGDKYPARLRAEARRYAERCMKDDDLLEERSRRPVNRIGSTAAEYGRGDTMSALLREPDDAAKRLMRRLHGLEDAQ
ncbi:MAG: hypothetical protein FWD17_18185 [Polyangiaceae bacterium]|nr:hypothetical protein [Polyangiaceae bacterium]